MRSWLTLFFEILLSLDTLAILACAGLAVQLLIECAS